MTAQEVIKNFMSALDNQNYADNISVLDDAVRNSSRFNGIQDALDNFLEDQKAAERAAIKKILGTINYKKEYDGLQLEDLLKLAEDDEELKAVLSETATYSDEPRNYGPEYSGSSKARSFTAAERIRMKTAEIFLEECGIELPYYCYRAISTDTKILMATYNSRYGETGNIDTGAISGSDAGGSTVKTPESIVQEIGNKYTAKDSKPQNISTGTNDWIVEATSYNDTITSGGADSIKAGDGNDVVYIQGNHATVSAGANNNDADTIIINADVKVATVQNLDEYDTLNINGDFEVWNMILDEDADTAKIIADSGRTLIIENWTTAKNSAVVINGESQKLGAWLNDFVEYEDTSTGVSLSAGAAASSPVVVNLSEVTSIGGSFNLASGARSATYSATSSSGNAGTISNEFPNISTFTTNGLTVELWGRSSSSSTSGVRSLTFDDLTDDEKTVFAGLYKWWIKEGLKLNEESYGLTFTKDDTFKDTLKVFFYNGGTTDGTLAFVQNYGNDLALAVNMTQFKNISATDENGAGENMYLDRTLAHELNHAVMKANMENFDFLPQFISEGLAELIHGIDDERVTRIWDLAARNTTKVGTDTTEATGGTVRIEDALNLNNSGTGEEDAYAAGYMFLRYFAKKAAEQTKNLPVIGDISVSVNLTGENATYYASLTDTSSIVGATTIETGESFAVGTATDLTYTPAAGIKQNISANDENWKFNSVGNNISITAGNGADSVEIFGSENKINLGNGDNRAEIDGDNNTVTAGNGANTFGLYYTAQNNSVNLGDGDNYIALSGGKNTIISGAGNDTLEVTLYTNIDGSASNNYIETGDGQDSLNISGSHNTVDVGAGNDAVVVFTTKSSINGGDGNDSISLYDSDNTIFGGKGNDTIRIQKSADLSEVTISDINPAEDILYFGSSFNYIEKIKDGITVTFSGNDSISVNIHFENINLPDLDNLVIRYNGGSSKGYKLSEYVSMLPFTGFKHKDGYAIYYVEDEPVAAIGGLKLDDVETWDGNIDSISIEGKVIKVSSKLIQDGITFESSDNYILKLEDENLNATSIASGSGADTLSFNDHKVVNVFGFESYTYFDYKIFGQGGNDSISFNKDDIKDNSLIYADGGEDNDTISATEVKFVGDGSVYFYGGDGKDLITAKDVGRKISNTSAEGDETLALTQNFEVYGDAGNDTISVESIRAVTSNYIFGGEENDSISIKNATMTDGYFGVYGDAGNDTINISGVTQSSGNFLVLGDNSSETTESNGNQDFISVENLNQSADYIIISGDNGNDTISVKNATVSGGILQITGELDDDSISAENLEVKAEGEIDIFGADGTNTISVNNVGSEGVLYIEGGADADNIYVNEVTQNGNAVAIYSFAGNDTISVNKFSVTDSVIEMDAGDGENNISVKKSTLSSANSSINGGTEADEILINEISATNSNIEINTGDGENNISVAKSTLSGGKWTISNGADSDEILINEISATDSSIEIKAGDGENNISVTKSTLSGSLLGIYSGENNDTVSISDISATDSKIEIDAGAGENNISVKNATLKGSGDLNIYGQGVNTISAENVTVDDAQIVNIYSGDSNDSISLNKATGINVTSGAGNDTLIFGANVTATLTDFSMDDTISLSSAVSTATFENGVLTLGNVKLTLQNVEDISEYVDLKIMNGSKTVKLGKLLGFLLWEVENGVAIYGDTITVSGVSENATAADFDFNGDKTVTVSEHAIKDGITISKGYTLALADDVIKKAEGTFPAWKVSKGTANYMTTTTEGYAVVDNKIVYQSETDGEIFITVTGLKTSATAKQISLDESSNTVSLAAAAVQGEVTITDGYALIMGKGAYSKTTVTGGDGDDTISNAGTKIAINGGAGNDSVSISGGTSGNTLNGGTGNDTIISANGKNIYQYADGDGNDFWKGFTANDSIQITSGEISSWKVNDSDLIFGVGKGSITIANVAGIKVNTAVGKNKNVINIYTAEGIYNDKQTDITLRADAKSYTAPAKPAVKSIDGSATNGVEIIGNTLVNSIVGGNGSDIIDGGAGNDYIFGNEGNDSINGGVGNDKIYGNDGDDTVLGGIGNDTISLGKGADVYIYEGGNDVITDYQNDDKISLASGTVSSVGISGKDLTLKIGKSGSLKIKNAVSKNVIINDKVFIYDKGKTYSGDKTNVTLTTASTLDSSVVNIDASAISAALKFSASDVANSIIGGKSGDSILGNGGHDTLVGNAGNDKIWGGDGNDVIDGGAGNDSLYGDAGKDTLNGGYGNDKLFGDAGEDVLDGGHGNDTLYSGAGNGTLTGGDGKDVFVYEGGNDFITDYAAGETVSLSTAITSSSVNGENVIFEMADGKITVAGGIDKKITTVTKIGSKTTKLTQIYTANGTYNEKQTDITLSAGAKSYEVPTKPAVKNVDGSLTNGVEIIGNKNADKITGGSGADIIFGAKGNDSISGNAGNDSINGGDGNDKISGDDGKDTISGGIGNDTISLGNGADVYVYEGGNDVITDFETADKISIASGEISSVGISGKDVTLKVGKNGSLKIKNAVGKNVTVNDEVFIYEKGVIYNGDKTAATVMAAASLASGILTLDGSETSTAIKFSANSSANLINGGKGADSISGGAGRDTIFGNNGTDKIWGDLDNDYLDGGAGNDTIYGGAGTDTILGDTGNDKLYGEDAKDLINGGAGNDELDGGAGDDTLIGDAGNDSIYGGTGNNSLVGGEGKDLFVHAGGEDYIEDYSAEDTIKFTSEITSIEVSNPNVIFKTKDGGKVIVRLGVGQKITYKDSKNKTVTETYTADKYQTLDLMYDNNFVTDEFGIDDITAPKFEVQNIETQNNLELSQPVITYGEDSK